MNCFPVALGLCLVLLASACPGNERPEWLHLIDDECACDAPLTLFTWNSDAEPEGGPPGMDEPLASDRPDFTEASSTVGRSVIQIESGYTYFHDTDGDTQFRAHSFPETLVRVGVLAEWLELRVAGNYLEERENTLGQRTTLTGAEDLYLGLKLGLTQQQGVLPEMALMPQMSAPIGSRVFTFDRVLPGVNWLYGWEISEFLSTAGSTQINMNVDGATDDEYLEFAQSWTIGYSLSERIGAYTEWFVITPSGAETAPTEHYFDGGLTYSLSNNIQFDIRGGKGLSGQAVDYFFGSGVVVRF